MQPTQNRHRRSLYQRRRSSADRIVQSSRTLCGRKHGQGKLGVKRVAIPTNGNAGEALAAYGKRAGMEVFVFCPADTPEVNVREIAAQGAKVWRVNGLINDCGRIVGQGKEAMNWFLSPRLKSRIASKVRRRWAWNWPSSSIGPCPT